MFKQLFATMNEVLDEIIKEYPTAVGAKKNDLAEQLRVLKTISDTFIEEWLLFEERMVKHEELLNKAVNEPLWKQLESTEYQTEAFMKGQGYFKLLMFENAINEFVEVIKTHPDFLVARLYLALGYLQIGDFSEAHRHFQFIIPMTNNSKMKAISLNALGCIQVKNKNMEKAYEYFKMAYKTDPSLPDPLVNIEVCMYNHGTLQYGTGLTH